MPPAHRDGGKGRGGMGEMEPRWDFFSQAVPNLQAGHHTCIKIQHSFLSTSHSGVFLWIDTESSVLLLISFYVGAVWQAVGFKSICRSVMWLTDFKGRIHTFISYITSPILKTEVDNGAYDSLIVLQQGNTFIFKLTRRPRKGDLHNTLSSI